MKGFTVADLYIDERTFIAYSDYMKIVQTSYKKCIKNHCVMKGAY